MDERSLAERTRERLTAYDTEDKGAYVFHDGGFAGSYAEDFADLLREWLGAVTDGA